MTKKAIENVNNAYRDGHSKAVVFADNSKYQQAVKRKQAQKIAIEKEKMTEKRIARLEAQVKQLMELMVDK